MRHRTLLFALVPFACAPRLVTQATPYDSTRGLSAAQLRRLAEAVDGNRTGHPLWAVVGAARGGYPEVVAVFGSPDSARTYLQHNEGVGYFIIGPNYAPPDGPGPMLYLVKPCVHDGSVTRYLCPGLDSLAAGAAAAVPMSDVLDVTVIVRTRDASYRTVLQAPHADALFFTLPAIDKFVVPYYARVYDAAYAADLREQALRMFRYRR